jgi:hypothetical protein
VINGECILAAGRVLHTHYATDFSIKNVNIKCIYLKNMICMSAECFEYAVFYGIALNDSE